MSTFRTEVDIDENPEEKITYDSKILSLGSEFSHALVEPLIKYRFLVDSNPYGTIYNPLSLFRALDISAERSDLDPAYFTECDGEWNHFDVHLRTRARSREELVTELNRVVADTRAYFRDADFLLLTFGSAYVYALNTDRRVVANCHRAPKNMFDQRLLSVSEIVEGFRSIYGHLNHLREIVLLVSPVMHTKSSITLNAVSKSVLRLACHEIVNEFPHVKYFPAYELLLHDLRDYRFYNKDFIHPNATAVDYIFDKFLRAYVDERDQKVVAAVQSTLEAIEHVPWNPQSEDYQRCVQDALDSLESIVSPIDLTELVDELRSRISPNR